MPKTKLIEIFGESVQLSERYTKDIAVSSLMELNGNSTIRNIQVIAIVVHDGLKYAIKSLKLYQLRKHIVYRWKFRIKYLISNLSFNSELLVLFKAVHLLEGNDLDKIQDEEKKKITQTLTSNLE